MHDDFKVYHFINSFKIKELNNLPKKVNIIYRNYSKFNEKDIYKLKNYLKKKGNKFYISNNIKLAVKLKLDGVYLPAFNKDLKIKNISQYNNIDIIGSAHNLRELNMKKLQGVNKIFISPIFDVPKKREKLGVYKFMNLSKHFSKKVVALGGINEKNIKILKMIKCYGFASISFIRKIYVK